MFTTVNELQIIPARMQRWNSLILFYHSDGSCGLLRGDKAIDKVLLQSGKAIMSHHKTAQTNVSISGLRRPQKTPGECHVWDYCCTSIFHSHHCDVIEVPLSHCDLSFWDGLWAFSSLPPICWPTVMSLDSARPETVSGMGCKHYCVL